MENNNTRNKDLVKGKVILFIIGVLVGAIVSTAAFFAYVKLLGESDANNDFSSQRMGGGAFEGKSGRGEMPPEMPNDNNSSQSSQGDGE